MNISEVILTVMVAGFGLNFALMYIIWSKIEKIEVRVNDIDRRLLIIETMLHMKDCCLLKSDQSLKKVD
jgi:uncharacterized membrane protein